MVEHWICGISKYGESNGSWGIRAQASISFDHFAAWVRTATLCELYLDNSCPIRDYMARFSFTNFEWDIRRVEGVRG
jgi:hypothetical protein